MIVSRLTPKGDLESAGGCNLCGHCCSFGSGIVLDNEIPKLAKHFNMTKEEFKASYLEPFTKFHTQLHRFKQMRNSKAPHGRCVFLDIATNRCTIHEIKPLHCRISTCFSHGEDVQKWFDVHYFFNKNDPQSVREYALYLEFKDPLPGAELESMFSNYELKKILSYGGMKNG